MQRDRLLQLYDLPSSTAGIERTEKKGAGGLFPCLLRLFPECLGRRRDYLLYPPRMPDRQGSSGAPFKND